MPLERLFAHFKDQNAPSTSAYDPADPESYDHFVKAMMVDAWDYELSILAAERSNAQLYYYGYEPWIGPYPNPQAPFYGEDPNATLGEILNKNDETLPNRSTYVSTDVRDAVMQMLPSLIRLFGASENPIFLVPRTQAEIQVAEQATNYVNYVFWNDNPGFLTLYGAFKDALTVKTGYIKWWTDDVVERRRKTFVNITADQIQLILSDDQTARVVDIGRPVRHGRSQAAQMPPVPPPQMQLPGPNMPPPGSAPPVPPGMPPGALAGGLPPPGPPPQPLNNPSPAPSGAVGPAGQQPNAPPPPIYDHVTIEFEVSKPLIKISGVPPEEMRLDRYARSWKESRIVGHERIVPVDQLIAMGYDRELCLDNIQTSESTFTTEPQLRNPGRFMGSRIGDGCKYGEWYIKIDKDGDGHPELRYICTIGEDRQIIHDVEANRVKFALFSCDPISHTIVGDSLADYTSDLQKIKTNMTRAVLDSAAESINPKTVINELMVTVDDALNDDVGAVIRTRGDVGNSVMFTNTPFLGQQALPVLQYLDSVLQRRTGLSDAAKGLDPKALQSSTMLGVEAVINGAQERIELVARVLAETGYRDLFTGLYNEICENPNQQRTIKINGQFVPYDTSTFDASMSVEVNENLGKGSDLVRMLALQQIKQDQQMVFMQFGPTNPVVGIPEMINTISDMLSIANIKNVARYFKTPTPQQIQAITSQPPKPDPMAVAAQAQLEKVRTESAKAVASQAFDQSKLASESALKRDQLHAKTAIDLQKLDLQGRQMGVDHHIALTQLGSQLMKDQSDSQAQDQQNQLATAQAQNQQDATATQASQAQDQALLQAQQQAQQHMQNMSKIAAQHTQAMTDMAQRHYSQMRGIDQRATEARHKIIAGALTGDADRESNENIAGFNRESTERVARMRPSGP
jgi:hypothetical protein